MKASEVEQEMQEFQNMMNKEAEQRGVAFINYKPVAIGYLDITEEYKKGIVSQTFINKLRQVWDVGIKLASLGFHECEFCIDEGNYEGRAKSSSEMSLKDRKNMIEYKFPEMLFHYIEKHNYQPPEEFIIFVLKLI